MNLDKINIEEFLSGGHPNSLGRTDEVVILVTEDASKNLFNQLLNTYGSSDPVVRLRVSSSLKRLVKLKPQWIIERFDYLVKNIAWNLNQPSVKWSMPQVFDYIWQDLSLSQQAELIELMKHYLDTENDWIVQNMVSEILAKKSRNNQELTAWIKPRLNRMIKDSRKSVSKKGMKLLDELN